MRFSSVCPWLYLASAQCSTCHYCNLLAPVLSLIGWLTLHCRSSWMTQMSGRSIGSLIARWIGIARGWVSSTWSSGKVLTTPPTQPAGNHWNTLQTQLTWSKHFTRHIQISPHPKSSGGGDHHLTSLLNITLD